jgi:hypothetical protein
MAEKVYTSEELGDWLVEKARGVPASRARKILTSNDERGSDLTIVGKMYFFKYDPLWKHKLAKYDKFPMCFPLSPPDQRKNGLGFLGLNLHYLDIGTRQAVVNEFMHYASNDRMDETTRMKINYDLIKNMSRLNSVTKPCIHRYIFKQCRSQFVEIYPEEYDKAIQLPIEDWVFKR